MAVAGSTSMALFVFCFRNKKYVSIYQIVENVNLKYIIQGWCLLMK